MKRLVLLINSLASGGAEKQAILLANILSRKYKVYLIALHGDNANQRFLNMLGTKRTSLIMLFL